jgi:hypothetical protein
LEVVHWLELALSWLIVKLNVVVLPAVNPENGKIACSELVLTKSVLEHEPPVQRTPSFAEDGVPLYGVGEVALRTQLS